MTAVYYAKVFPLLEEDTFLQYLEKVEKRRREKLLHMKDQGSISHTLTAGCLLHKVLCKWTETDPECSLPFEIGYGKEGKPYLLEKPEIHFNLSHSGGYVCCAIADMPVGVDIQKKTVVKSGIAGRFFTDADNQKLSECGEKEKTDLFFRMWSIKESFVKLTGKGLKQGMDSFEINWQKGIILEEDKNEPSAYFMECADMPAYSFCVCTKEPQKDAVWEEILL